MTPEAQRIAILEACGWQNNPKRGWYKQHSTNEIAWYCVRRPSDGMWVFPPDYLNDLNAMREAEKTLNDVQRRAYAMKVHELTYASHSFGRPENYWICIHANAAKRAEAFLKTTGRWKD